MDYLNHYQILGISSTASSKEIKDAYRRLARQYHPDLNPGDLAAAEKFKQINQAYEVLFDPTQRSLYDYELNNSTNKSTNKSSSPNIRSEEYYKQGLKKSQITKYKEAIQEYTKAIELNPNYADAYNRRGLCYFKLGESSEAIKDFNKAIYVNPNLAEAYYNRAMARFKLGYAQAAINDYSQALEFKPNYAQAYYRRGLVFADLKHTQGAIEDFHKAAQLFSQLHDIANYQLAVDELKKQGGNWKSSNLIADIFASLIAVTFNPLGEMQPAFVRLNRHNFTNSIFASVIFALIFDLCFVTGVFIILEKSYNFSDIPIFRLILVGWITYLSLVISSFAVRNIFRGKGNWAGDLFIAGISILPLGYLSLLIGILNLLGVMDISIVLGISTFALSYTILTLFSGCKQISHLSEPASSLAVPIMLIVLALPIVILFPLFLR